VSPPFSARHGAGHGSFDCARVSGVPPLSNIGAYELQQDEIAFDAGFEGYPPLPF
jgi:hypothetical protein